MTAIQLNRLLDILDLEVGTRAGETENGMSEKIWLRFCYRTATEIIDPESYMPTGDGWIYALLAVRSDGYMFQSRVVKEAKASEAEEMLIRKQLRFHLESMIEDIPSDIHPTAHVEDWMKGIVYQNGDEWTEAV